MMVTAESLQVSITAAREYSLLGDTANAIDTYKQLQPQLDTYINQHTTLYGSNSAYGTLDQWQQLQQYIISEIELINTLHNELQQFNVLPVSHNNDTATNDNDDVPVRDEFSANLRRHVVTQQPSADRRRTVANKTNQQILPLSARNNNNTNNSKTPNKFKPNLPSWANKSDSAAGDDAKDDTTDINENKSGAPPRKRGVSISGNIRSAACSTPVNAPVKSGAPNNSRKPAVPKLSKPSNDKANYSNSNNNNKSKSTNKPSSTGCTDPSVDANGRAKYPHSESDGDETKNQGINPTGN